MGELQQMKNEAASDQADNMKKTEDAEEKLKTQEDDKAEVKEHIDDANKSMSATKHQKIVFDHVKESQAATDSSKRAMQNSNKMMKAHKEATKFVPKPKPAPKKDEDDDDADQDELEKKEEKEEKDLSTEKRENTKGNAASIASTKTNADSKPAAAPAATASASLAKTEVSASLESFMKTESSQYQSQMDKLVKDFDLSLSKIHSEFKMTE